MSRDRSLGEYVDDDDVVADWDDAGDGAPSASSDTARSDAATRNDSNAAGEGDVGAVESTYRWSPEERPCANCGDSVRERWREDGELVCVDCKEW